MNELEPARGVVEAPPAVAPGPVATAAEPAPINDLQRRNHRRRCLLDQLLEAAPDHRLSRGEANKKLSAALRRELGLTPENANRLREELAQAGYVRITRKGQNVAYELTDAGREYLQTLPPYPPEDEVEPVSEEIQRYRTAHLLFQLFRAEGWTLARGKANRALGRSEPKLKPSAANQLRRQLARQGALEIVKGRRSESYRLTPRGEALLATLRHYPPSRLSLRGEQLNALLDRVRGPVPQQPVDLSQAVSREFEELRRERYGHTGLVPIHEVRRRIGEKYGPEAARHDNLDEPIRELWRQGRVRLIALADLQRATPEQLNDSVPGVNETLFFMEVAREQSALG